MGVICQILLDKTEDGVFKAGGLVTGTLKYFIDKPTQYRRITMSFVGKGECQWTDSDSNSDDDDSTDYSNSEEYFIQAVNVYLGTNKNELLSGAFEYPFRFLLPVDIPPSFKDKISCIKYKITVTFVKANFMKTSKNFDVEIPVTSYVNLCSLEPLMFSLKKDLFSLNASNKIEIKGEIMKTCVTPGDNFQMTLTVNNDSNTSVFIKTELVSRVTYVSSCKHKKVDEEIVKNTCIMESVATNGVTTLTRMVPTYPNIYSIQHTKVLVREYKVKVTAKLPFPHIDAVLEIPVAIGLKKHELLVPTAVYNQNDEEPPPYLSIPAHNEHCINKGNDGEDVKKIEEVDSSKGEKKELDKGVDQENKGKI